MKLDDLALSRLADLERGPGRALLEATVAIGFSEPVARAGLEAELEAWARPGALDAVLAELDEAPSAARRPETVLIIAARTLPASAMRQVLMARLLGARVLLKPASGQGALADAIGAADPEIEVRAFESTDSVALAEAIAASDAVVVLGGDAAVAAVRAATPEHKAFVGYGHKVSAAWLEAGPSDAALRGLAEDLCAWDQAGCLSPQVAWTRDAPESVAASLAQHVRAIESRLPLRRPPEAARERHTAVTLARMRGSALETATAALLTLPDSALRVGPGWRTLWLLPADGTALQAAAPVLSTIGYAGPPERAPALPGVRVCDLGRMQRPPLTWQHDGRPNLLPMLAR